MDAHTGLLMYMNDSIMFRILPVSYACRDVFSLLQTLPVNPLVPREFTAVGYLERLDAYLKHQDYCGPSSQSLWPPQSGLRVVSSAPGESCVQACFHKGRELWQIRVPAAGSAATSFTECFELSYKCISGKTLALGFIVLTKNRLNQFRRLIPVVATVLHEYPTSAIWS